MNTNRKEIMNTNSKIRSILIIKFLMLSLCTFAQIKGIVREKDSNLPMEFVNVTLLSASDSAFITGTTTDSLGMFIIPNTITNGIIKVSYIDCKTQFRQIMPKDTLYNFFLQPNENLLKEVIVKQYSVNFYAASASKLNISLILSLFNVVFGFFSNTSIIRCT